MTAEILHYRTVDTPIGALRLVADGPALARIEFEGQHGSDGTPGSNDVLQRCEEQLAEYFDGKRREFDLPLSPGGTVFQQQVWEALHDIPFGEVRSYRDIAEHLGNRRAVRAVGAANGRNPIPIVVPCHRVIGSNGALTGFAGGLPA